MPSEALHLALSREAVTIRYLTEDFNEVDYNLDQVDEIVHLLMNEALRHYKLIRVLDYELEQRRRQMLNLESRLFTLEEGVGRKGDKYGYY